MAYKQNLPFPALLHHPFAALRSNFSGMDKSFSDTPVDGRTLQKCVQCSHFPSCNPPHGKESHSSHFHFFNLLFLQMDLRLGRRHIHVHKKLSISFLPKRTHSVSSPYTWEWCFRQPKPMVYSTLDCKL